MPECSSAGAYKSENTLDELLFLISRRPSRQKLLFLLGLYNKNVHSRTHETFRSAHCSVQLKNVNVKYDCNRQPVIIMAVGGSHRRLAIATNLSAGSAPSYTVLTTQIYARIVWKKGKDLIMMAVIWKKRATEKQTALVRTFNASGSARAPSSFVCSCVWAESRRTV